MKLITRSALGSALMAEMLTGRPYQFISSTTLNEKYEIQSGILPAAGTMPFLNYYVIGNGGHTLSIGANGIAKPEPVQHLTTDCALYNMIPFVLVEPDADLAPSAMLAYRLRVPVTFNSTAYIAYYAKVFDYTGVAVTLQYETVNSDGTVTVVPWVPNSSNLNPMPPALSSSGVNVVTGQYIVASEQIPLNLTAQDATNLINVANIMYGDPDLAIISEIGLMSGTDKQVSGTGNGGTTITYTEAIVLQMVSIFNSFYAMQYASDGVSIMLDVGATEPLLALTNSST